MKNTSFANTKHSTNYQTLTIYVYTVTKLS